MPPTFKEVEGTFVCVCEGGSIPYVVVVVVVVVVALLFNVHGKHLRSCRDGQST